jgi:hypothetical protein
MSIFPILALKLGTYCDENCRIDFKCLKNRDIFNMIIVLKLKNNKNKIIFLQIKIFQHKFYYRKKKIKKATTI